MKSYPPEIDVVFELTLDGQIPENTPLGLVQAFGYNPEGWRYQGPTVTGKETKKFMLVQIGYQPNLAAAKTTLEALYGSTPEGQWLKAFKDAYPQPDGKRPVGIADGSWVDPGGISYYPFIDTFGERSFRWTNYKLAEYWRWLVQVPATDPAAKQSRP